MFLSIKELEIRRIHFTESFAPGAIDFSEVQIRQATPLETDGTATLLQNTGGEVRIQGRYRVEMTAECDRCLAPATFPLEGRFDLFYRPAGSQKGLEVELDEGEIEIGFYPGPGIELADVIREQVLLALPMHRLCREDCRGICPVCGANRNESACACETRAADERWAALRGLKL